jgi:hypothetical protein
MRQTLPLPLASARVVVPGFSLFLSLSLCVLYPSAKAVKSRKVIYELYNTAGGRGGGAMMMTESLDLMPIHKRRMCVFTAHSTLHTHVVVVVVVVVVFYHYRIVHYYPRGSVFAVCAWWRKCATFLHPPHSPSHFFIFILLLCLLFHNFWPFVCVCVCLCVATLRLKKKPETSAKQQLFQPQIYIVLKN